MQYYPDQRHLLEATTIRRERMLPEDAVGRVEVREGIGVNLRDVVARGRLPSRFVLVEGAAYFRLKNPNDLNDLMLAQVGDVVDVKAPLAGKSGQRGSRLLSPVKGIVTYIGDGLIVIQSSPEEVDLEAGLDGQ